MHLNDNVQRALSSCAGSLAASLIKLGFSGSSDAKIREFAEAAKRVFAEHISEMTKKQLDAIADLIVLLPQLTRSILTTAGAKCEEDKFVGIVLGVTETVGEKLSVGMGADILEHLDEADVEKMAQAVWKEAESLH